MKVAVTGGSGFVGSAVCRLAHEMGWDLLVVGRNKRSFDAARLPASVAFAAGDVTKPPSLDGLFDGVDVVIHAAGQVGGWDVDETKLFLVNAEGTRHVLAESIRAGVSRFVHVSTPGVCGFSGCLVEEDAPYAPRGAYEESKVAGERIVLSRRREIGVVVLRPDFVYGPGDRRRVGLFRAVQGRRFFIPGTGDACWRPTHVEDVARAVVEAVVSPAALGQVFNVAGPRVVRVAEFFDTMAQVLGASTVPRDIPVGVVRGVAGLAEAFVGGVLGRKPPLTRSQVDFLTMDHGTSADKAFAVLGFTARVDIAEGLAQTVAWYRAQGLL